MPCIPFLDTLFSWLRLRRAPGQPNSPAPAQPINPAQQSPTPAHQHAAIAWGAHVSSAFRQKVIAITGRLAMDPNHLMAIMAFETGRSFDPAVTNHAGSGATGLIQFMPATARALGTSTAALARMRAIDQLDYVEAYLAPYKGRMKDLPSAYMAVLYPRAVDKEPGHVLFRKGSKAYKLNRGLDTNGNGEITKAEASAKVAALLAEGLRPGSKG
ncbi:transglycosylase SLT domain-containing protein [Hoeflea alexandrii]|uniref:transglycosylase SLT domain-containing protein n=1 Tax=Hoeflea alexandrii TaxID=288436 RepID=UPI0022AEB1B4|nr:transglycosylase SLT domain-containing protein [Hoeflea alexandrii]MCZ4288196.1 transglycosylase SLT domain-containing protein [Hoeflea alexandrii]